MQLRHQIHEFSLLPEDEARVLFHETGARLSEEAKQVNWDRGAVVRVAYRPMDVRSLYLHEAFIDRRRPALQDCWGATNVGMFAMPNGTGAGPAIWIHSDLPDRHAFRGSYGGYAFPLWDRRTGNEVSNFAPYVIAGLSATYGQPVAVESIFDATAALLSATTYTRRFAWDLEESFAHIPFPADSATFAAAARIGAEIRALETFARSPAQRFRTARLAGRATGVTLAVPTPRLAYLDDGAGGGFIPLQEDQSLRIAGVPNGVWEFAVSGYPVLYRFLSARNGEALDAPMHRAILDLVWRLTELLHWFDAADAVLADALVRPLTNADLGLAPASPTRPAGLDSDHHEPDDTPA